ncbi:hypothetical protein BRADI_1g72856v3 [Brachypodium distachyon]|uniref:Uncharacterized protein n=1 Tax=Brachypodium distachyon TaxID=15368 RepID=A0A2K2DUT7_BRADI|nr:hypothetical protein BRADI_1g72856v3 [Brachypodium distachyon]
MPMLAVSTTSHVYVWSVLPLQKIKPSIHPSIHGNNVVSVSMLYWSGYIIDCFDGKMILANELSVDGKMIPPNELLFCFVSISSVPVKKQYFLRS